MVPLRILSTVLLFCASSFRFDHVNQRLSEGSKCNNNHTDGVCTPFPNCPQALEQVKLFNVHNYTRCSFNQSVEVVCCPVAGNRTTIARKSIQVCNIYRTQNVRYRPPSLVLNGKNSLPSEFPHAVALGLYDEDKKVYKFHCGGTLISDRYVVTAAHCIANTQGHELKIIRMGTIIVPLVSSIENDTHHHKVKRVILHPEYRSLKKINDIALVELERNINFTYGIRPACLYVRNEDPPQMEIVGFSATNIYGNGTEILQKANVTSVPIQQCSVRYRGTNVNIDSTKICAVDDPIDTCPADSGAPLHIREDKYISLVGITSFSFPCGSEKPVVYTRVSSYLDWIESVVWP